MKTSFCAVVDLLHAAASVEERLAGELASVHGVAVNEAMLLMHLERAPLNRLTRMDLAKRLHLNPSTVTRMAAPMEKIGLVKRQSDARDARMAYVALTKNGLKVVSEVRATLEKRSAGLFRDRWSDGEIETLASLLARITMGEPGALA